MKRLVTTLALAALVAAASVPTLAAEIRVLCAVGLQNVFPEALPRFQRTSGHTLSITYAVLGDAVKKVQAGETYDVVLLPRQGIDRLVAEGKADAADVTPVVRSVVAAAFPKNGPRPDLSSPERFRQVMLSSRVAVTDPSSGGASAVHFRNLFEGMGIAEQMRPRLRYPAQSGGVQLVQLLKDGSADIALNQLQTFSDSPR